MHSYWSGSGGSMVFPFGCHTPTKCWLGYGSPAGDYGLPVARSICPFHLQNSSVVLSYDFLLLGPVSLPCLARMGCVVGLNVGCLRFLVYVVFLSRWSSSFLVLRIVCSLSTGGFSYGLHVCRGFWFDVFRFWVSLVVSTHSTDVICLLSFPGHWHGQGQRVLAGGIRRWPVVGGLVSS